MSGGRTLLEDAPSKSINAVEGVASCSASAFAEIGRMDSFAASRLAGSGCNFDESSGSAFRCPESTFAGAFCTISSTTSVGGGPIRRGRRGAGVPASTTGRPLLVSGHPVGCCVGGIEGCAAGRAGPIWPEESTSFGLDGSGSIGVTTGGFSGAATFGGVGRCSG